MKIELYKEYVEDFLDTLNKRETAKVLRNIKLFQEFGFDLPSQYLKQIDGKLWELRIKFSNNHHRIFYFIYEVDVAILLMDLQRSLRKPHL